MHNNNLDHLDGAAELTKILQAIESAATMDALVELAEELHMAGHTLLDALEQS
jgi:hypothetical protein